MRATVMYEAGDVRIENVPDPKIIEPTDAIIGVTRACICGSDLWPYRQMEHSDAGCAMGHEAIGIVEDIAAGVRTVKRGDLVIMPFAFSDGTCEFCREGLQTSCVHGGFFGCSEGVGRAQAKAVRIPQADGTLFRLEVEKDNELMPSLVTLSERHAERIALAKEFGATDIVRARGDEAVARVHELTGGFGVHSVLECGGLDQSMERAIKIARPGGAVGRIGVPQHERMPASEPAFYNNITVSGGPAPVRLHRRAFTRCARRKDPPRLRLRSHGGPRRSSGWLSGDERARASEVLTHLLFYAGWPNVISAVPVAKEAFEKRPK